MKKFIAGPLVMLIIAIICLGMAAWLNHPKYVYPHREAIIVSDDKISWDQYCWYEYSNGYIIKKYIGRFTLQARVTDAGEFLMSQCRSSNIN